MISRVSGRQRQPFSATGGVALLLFTALLTALPWSPTASAAEDSPPLFRALDVSFALDHRNIRSEKHFGWQARLAWRPAPRHRFQYRHANLNNDVSNAFRAVGEIMVCSLTLGLADHCNIEDKEYRLYRENALLYQYQALSSAAGGGGPELWLGAGPGYVTEEVRFYDSDEDRRRVLSRHNDTGLAWSIEAIGRGQRWFASAALEGNTTGNAVGLILGLGVSLF